MCRDRSTFDREVLYLKLKLEDGLGGETEVRKDAYHLSLLRRLALRTQFGTAHSLLHG